MVFICFSFILYSPVNDITSTLTITVKDESIINTMKDETLGKLSIPLLTIINEEKAWFDLNGRSKRHTFKGNSPKIQLQMSIAWNPVIHVFIASNILPTNKDRFFFLNNINLNSCDLFVFVQFYFYSFSGLFMVTFHYR